ncbi:MAG: ribonuclease J, partial [Coriobacteriales bacterium]|nr:ribonuclease J [Coriobacteriales bacterium]
EPEIIARGVTMGDGEELLEEARARITKKLVKLAAEGVTDSAIIRNAIRESLSQLLWERIRRRPMIIPVVMEV